MIKLGVAFLLVASMACGGSQGTGTPPTCESSRLVGGMTTPARAAIAELEALRARGCGCTEQACAIAVQSDFGDYIDRNQSTIGSQDEQATAFKAAEALRECLVAVLDEPPPAAASEPDYSGTKTGLADCDVYIRTVEQFIACDKVPQASRDATRQGIEGMVAAWGDTSGMPPEARDAALDSCRQATDALRQGAKAMGCPLDP